jgi:phage tail sheath protein FI
MPTMPTYPGMYVEEIPSGVHPIAGVSTSDTAFIDAFAQGPVGVATRVTGFDDFLRRFGPLADFSPAGYGVMQYFVNGGQVAWIVRVAPADAQASTVVLEGGSPAVDTLTVAAISPGTWGDALQVGVDLEGTSGDAFNLVVRLLGEVGGRPRVVASEVHRNVTMTAGSPRNVVDVVTAASTLISVSEVAPDHRDRLVSTGSGLTAPSKIADVKTAVATLGFKPLEHGSPDPEHAAVDATALIGGLHALEHIEPGVVNLLCIPAAAGLDGSAIGATPVLTQVAGAVADFCERFRCFYLLDIPEGVDTPERALAWLDANTVRDHNAAVHFPRLQIVDPDPLRSGALRNVASSGTIAGLYARTDTDRGIWKAPAGTGTQLRAIASPAGGRLNDADSAALNPLGINAIRTLPTYGTVCWGARTLFGADVQTSEWKYVPIRRTALYIEESLVQGLRWVVFEPNDEPLWAQIRLNVTAFMQSMFRKGAFQGRTPREAYLVRCDAETTTQADIDRGIVNILVGFAPLKPAEFVVIQLQQLTRPADQ